MGFRDSIVVVIPTHTFQFKEYEELAIANCQEKLKSYSIVVVHPQSISGQNPSLLKGCHKIALPNHWFENVKAYNRLKTSKYFYNLFNQYQYLLTHEADAWVFEDQLEFWCAQGYDYIGAPWFQKFEEPSMLEGFRGVGNSGFSLRNIQSCRRVLDELKYPSNDWKKPTASGLIKKILQKPYYSLYKGENHFVQRFYHGNEDWFWGMEVPKYCSWFRVAPIMEAVKFSFEVAPERLWELNDFQLPFGCHAWYKYSPEFWSHFIPGYTFSTHK
jgi:hypothetical protein